MIKIASTQSSLVKRSLEENFQDWMVVPWFLINKYIDKKIKFHKNLCISNGLLSNFPAYYQIVFVRRIKTTLLMQHYLSCQSLNGLTYKLKQRTNKYCFFVFFSLT